MNTMIFKNKQFCMNTNGYTGANIMLFCSKCGEVLSIINSDDRSGELCSNNELYFELCIEKCKCYHE